MKIIKDTIWWKFTCRVCKAKLQAEPDDVTGRPNIDSDGDKVGVIPVVACEKCGAIRDVPDRKITPLIRQIAIRKYREVNAR